MGADSVYNVIRRSPMLDTSGAEPPRAIQMVAAMGGGVYSTADGDTQNDSILTGRISLGILAAFILGAMAFYLWTNGIQGGG